MAKRSKVSDADPFDIILEVLERYGGRQKSAGDWTMVCCPFHEDGSPSMGVYMRRDDPFRPLGTINCFGCTEGKGNWNKFARKIGETEIPDWEMKEHSIGNIGGKNLDDELLGESGTTLRQLLKVMNAGEAQPWPEYINWRGIPGKVLAAIDGMIITDDRNEDIAALFPVKVNGKVKGGVKAIYQKRYAKQLGYVTSDGKWVANYGLFPYDFVRKKITEQSYDFVILVEGPRDALRLIKLGIPALAILGSQAFTKTKTKLIQSLGVQYVYALPDNDKAGTEMWKLLKANFQQHTGLILKRLKLPRDKDEEGKLIKMDPFSAPVEVIKRLKTVLRENNEWTKFRI